MASEPSKLAVGDYTYTIFEHHIWGRLKIQNLRGGAANPKSGMPLILVFFAALGNRLEELIARKSHQGMRYYDEVYWPAH